MGMVYMINCIESPICILIKIRKFIRKKNLKELVSDISHQTKTPLSNIKLYLEMLTDESNYTKSKEIIDKMGRQVEKLDF